MHAMLVKLALELKPHHWQLTLEEAERAYLYHYITDRQWMIYSLFWIWSSPRYGGEAGRLQRKYYAKRGQEAYHRRFNQFSTAFNAAKQLLN